jgi:predicted outer membrane repeat protein
MYCRDSSPAFSDCVFEGNHGEYDGGAVDCVSSSPFFVRCQFIANTAADRGGAIFCNQSSPVFIDCTFDSNSASTGGALCYAVASTPTATRCTFTSNSAFQLGGAAECHAQCYAFFAECVFLLNTVTRDGAALAGVTSWIEIDACTFYENAAGHDGAGVYLEEGGIAVLDNTIIAGSTDGQAVYGDDAGCAATASCCDVFGNVDGDWVSCLAGQQGVNGNISEDPLFCDAPNGDLTLHADSPCAPENSPAGCGLIGSLPVGCGVAAVSGEVTALPWAGLRVYPNPVRAGSIVEWPSSDRAAVGLKLYDPTGRLVLAYGLTDGTSGLQQVRWSDVVGGHTLAPGIYFLELRAASGSQLAARSIVLR